MVHPVEELIQIALYYPLIPLVQIALCLFDCLMCFSPFLNP
jgi:hypothetical protein